MSSFGAGSVLATQDVIVAESSPRGRGAISLVRVSGEGAVKCAAELNGAIAGQSHGEACLRKLAAEGEWLDDAVVTVFRAPCSYTGQDVVELAVHGNPLIVSRVMETLQKAGARMALPGEFTRRAYLNGRLPLSRAEAVGQLIHAESESALRAAGRLYAGGLERELSVIREGVLHCLSEVEAMIDFVEEGIEQRELSTLAAGSEECEQLVEGLLKKIRAGRLAQEGVAVALAGRPNAGKSRLLNALSGQDRAIVSPTPGTTRDTIDLLVEWDGLAVRLVDTAGLRESEDPIEQEGVRRSQQALAKCDVLLWIEDVTEPDEADLPEVPEGMRVIRVRNKCDLLPEWPEGGAGVCVSALHGEGLEALRGQVLSAVAGNAADCSEPLAVGDAHTRCLKQAQEALGRTSVLLRGGEELEIAALELREALGKIGEITQPVNDEDVLGEIFANFCIGK